MRRETVNALSPFLNDGRYLKTLSELSKSDPNDGSAPNYCLSSGSALGDLPALDFDAIKSHWSDSRGFPFRCRSADALLERVNEFYLVEFKSGKVPVANWIRKVYDSSIALVDNGVLTWHECQTCLTFILVQVDADRYFPNYDLGRRMRKSYGSRWEYDPADIPPQTVNSDPRILTGQVAHRIYVMNVPDFQAFAARWPQVGQQILEHG